MKLAHDVVGSGKRRAVVLHGILGSARNWRAYARRLAGMLPEWQFLLLDLRHHGESHAEDGRPDSLEAAADDVIDTAGPGPIDAIIGHSFGGKVALALQARTPEPVAQTWVLDATPFPVDTIDPEVAGVLEAVARIPMPASDHDAVRDAMLGAGFSEGLAGWMTTNLRREPEGQVWRFNLAGVRRLLDSYAITDLGPAIQQARGAVHLVQAGRSDRWTPEVARRLSELGGALHVHRIAEAGHWVHVDAPDALAELIVGTLRQP